MEAEAELDYLALALVQRRQGGFEGQATDFEIHACSVVALKRRIEEIIAQHSGQIARKVSEDLERDYLMTSERANQ
jgi:ATP-dependent Clp protease protease subunit